MKIHDDHMYHGAALIQIAEHPEFTAINSLKIKGNVLRNSYKINDGIGIHLKYASKPKKAFREYPFTFHQDEIEELAAINGAVEKLFVALVCVKDREICCLSYEELIAFIEARAKEKGAPEPQYVVLVTAPKNKSLRAYVSAPGVKKTILGKALVVSRKAFPDVLFG